MGTCLKVSTNCACGSARLFQDAQKYSLIWAVAALFLFPGDRSFVSVETGESMRSWFIFSCIVLKYSTLDFISFIL